MKHGTQWAYISGCRCPDCKKAFALVNSSRVAKFRKKEKERLNAAIETLQVVEQRLRGHEGYHLAMDRFGRVGLGQFICAMLRTIGAEPKGPMKFKTFLADRERIMKDVEMMEDRK